MNTRNIIYDKRFQEEKFAGYPITIPKDNQQNIFVTSLYAFEYTKRMVRSEIKEWLIDKGPWKQLYGTFYFAREETASLFRLTFC